MPHHRLRLRQIEQTGGKASHYPDHGQQIRALAQMLAGIEAYGLDSPAKTVGQAKPVADSGKHLRRPGRKAGEIEGEPQTQHFQPIRIGGGHIAYREWECATPGRIGKAHDILRLKGFVDIAGKPLRLLVQGVGSRIQHQFDRKWPTGGRRGGLVVIGEKGFDRDAIRALIAS